MRIGWIGVHEEGVPAFAAVCQTGYDVTGLITLEPDKAAARCGSAEYAPLCRQFGVPVFEVGSINAEDGLNALGELQADVVVVLGWGQILKPPALERATIGMVGAHASLLPHNRGSAPVNWAIIRGEKESGNSLIWLSQGVDCGAIIDQRRFRISQYDTCATIYEQVAESNCEMLLELLPRLAAGVKTGQPQLDSGEDRLPRRRPQDGIVDWAAGSTDVYNLIRALAKPYPGAFGYLNGQPLRIWRAAHIPMPASNVFPGTILGSVCSPDEHACGQLVACGDGAILLLEVEDAAGRTIDGRELSELPWQGKEWGYAA